MDSPTRQGVASLVRQRGAGEISRETFFERLAVLQQPAPSGARESPFNCRLGDSFASVDGFQQASGSIHPPFFSASLEYAARQHEFGQEYAARQHEFGQDLGAYQNDFGYLDREAAHANAFDRPLNSAYREGNVGLTREVAYAASLDSPRDLASFQGHFSISREFAHTSGFQHPMDVSSSHLEFGHEREAIHAAGLQQHSDLASLVHEFDTDGEDLHDWHEGPPLLTGEAARALILGVAPGVSSVPGGQNAWNFQSMPGAMAPSSASASAQHPSMAWQDDPEPLMYAPEGWPAETSQHHIGMFDQQGPAFASPTAYGIASSRTGQEALGLGMSGCSMPTVQAPEPLLLPSPPESPARALVSASPRSLSPSRVEGGDAEGWLVTPNTSFASNPSHMGGVRRSTRSVDSPTSSFAQRSEIWEIQKARRCQELRRQRDVRESAECSFRPNSAGTARSTTGSRQGRSSASAVSSGRVHTESSSRANSVGALSSGAEAKLVQRLSKNSSSADLDALRWKKQRERDELQECTFQPDVSKSSRSRRLRAHSASGLSTGDAASEVDQGFGTACKETGAFAVDFADRRRPSPKPFIPLTNSVAPEMVNARAYLAEDVFSRLVQPCPEPLMVNASFRCAGGASNLQKSSMEEQASEYSSVSRCRSGPNVSEDSFLSFLHRQNTREEWRRERLDSITQATAPSLHPELCNRSLHLADRHRTRCEQKQERENLEGVANAKEPAPEAECSFTPCITAAAKQRERRSLSELSAGDQKRRDAKVARHREQLRAKEMKDVSFAPRLVPFGSDVQSRLRVLQEPDSYLERLARAQKVRDAKVEEEKKRRLAKEFEQCTFKPKVTSAPAFVQQMAESYRLVRNLKENQNLDECAESNSQPDWR